ncbi:MAG: peptide deformylase [Deltaproteobacteria bacterium]|nr:peptide deformylase [Deltaproteobacteria bacterium]
MTVLEVLTYPDKFLKKKTKPVEKIDDNIRKLVKDMADTMYEAPGVGLAAIQVGSDKSVILYDPAPDKEQRAYSVLINPVIVSMDGEYLSENEGCLSVPDFRADVKRAEFVVAKGLDLEGNPVNIETDGILSVILQHEIDHLNGILFIDRISSLKREMYKRKVKKQLKKTN